jgi:hypothetical protein
MYTPESIELNQPQSLAFLGQDLQSTNLGFSTLNQSQSAFDSLWTKPMTSSNQLIPLTESEILTDEIPIYSVNGFSPETELMLSGQKVESDTARDPLTGGVTAGVLGNDLAFDSLTEKSASSQLKSKSDNAPFTPNLNAADVTQSGDTTYAFTIQYSDNTAVDLTTLDNKDVVVTGPLGFSQSAKLVSVDKDKKDSLYTATYSIDAPGGSWNTSDKGTYFIDLKANQVSDISSNFIPANTLGSFNVNPNPGTIELEPKQLVNEGNKTASLTVNRLDGSDGTVTVNYKTVDGIAIEGSDYTATSGTLSFGAGETSKTIKIPILEDTQSEKDETFNLSLENIEGGATLKKPENAIFTIVDNDSFSPDEMSLLESRYLFTLNVKVDDPIPVGTTSQGTRNIIDVAPGGTFEGAAAQGVILESGGEWLTTRPDGVALADARIALKTNDGHVIYTQIKGFADNFAEVAPSLFDDDETQADQPDYFRLTFSFETGSQRYSWLNQKLAVGKGRFLDNNSLQFDVYQIL